MKKLLKKERCARSFVKFDLKMKLTTLLLLTALIGLHANNGYSQKNKITLKANNSSIATVIDNIEATTKFRFIYSNKQIDVTRKVSFNVTKAAISTVLDILFGQTNITYKIRDKQVVLKSKSKEDHKLPKQQAPIPQEPIIITGNVSDGITPLVGASVVLKGTTTGVATDFDGDFSIKVNVGDTLVISYTGYVTSEVSATKEPMAIVLKEDSLALNEVVLTGQGIKKSKKALGYSVTKLAGEFVEGRAEADISNSLVGQVAGLSIIQSSGSSGSVPAIRVRSSLSITQSNTPLIIVNNVPFQGSLIDIDPADVLELSILRGLNASILYGSEGKDGVILIQTKSGSSSIGKESTTIRASQQVYTNTVANLPNYQNKYGQGSDFTYVDSDRNSWGPAFSDLDFVAHPYAGLGNIFPEFEGVEIPYEAVPNNVSDFFKTGIGTLTSFSINTSQKKTAFNMSTSYTDESGIVGRNSVRRFTMALGGASTSNR